MRTLVLGGYGNFGARRGAWLGITGFSSMLAIHGLMVFKPGG